MGDNIEENLINIKIKIQPRANTDMSQFPLQLKQVLFKAIYKVIYQTKLSLQVKQEHLKIKDNLINLIFIIISNKLV